MKLLTEAIKKRMKKYPLYSQDGKKDEAIVIAKFFINRGAWTWYITEGDIDEDIMYGITVNGHGECEYGYVSISEMENLRTSDGLSIEREISFKPCTLRELNDRDVKRFLNRLYREEEVA